MKDICCFFFSCVSGFFLMYLTQRTYHCKVVALTLVPCDMESEIFQN